MAEVLKTANQTISVTYGTDGTKIASGRTTPGATDWKASSPYLFVTIDTSAASFTIVPIYTSSLGGDRNLSLLTGTSSIYNI